MKIVQSELDIMVQWISERDTIRRKKEGDWPKPWTQDPLLRDNRWCNVRRMDDRVSVDLITSWYPGQADPQTYMVAAVLARLVNWPASLEDITGPRRFVLDDLFERARRKLQHRADMGWKVFTGAYVVPGVPGMNKIDSVCALAERVHFQAHLIYDQSSMRSTWSNLVKQDGLGSFLAGQMVADLAHLPPGAAWADRHTWAPLGPGSARGINRVLGRPKDKAVSQEQFEQELPALIDTLKPRIQALWEDRQLQAMDIQNCLCEFDKYRRLQLGEGKVRARYDGVGQPQEALL